MFEFVQMGPDKKFSPSLGCTLPGPRWKSDLSGSLGMVSWFINRHQLSSDSTIDTSTIRSISKNLKALKLL